MLLITIVKAAAAAAASAAVVVFSLYPLSTAQSFYLLIHLQATTTIIWLQFKIKWKINFGEYKTKCYWKYLRFCNLNRKIWICISKSLLWIGIIWFWCAIRLSSNQGQTYFTSFCANENNESDSAITNILVIITMKYYLWYATFVANANAFVTLNLLIPQKMVEFIDLFFIYSQQSNFQILCVQFYTIINIFLPENAAYIWNKGWTAPA